MKETYYFPHDYNAHNDPKCSALINDFGLTGYGLYWSLIEILHEQQGYIKKFPKLFDGLSYQLRISKDDLSKLVEALLHDYNLLEEDENNIWSERVLRNLEDRKIKYEAKAEAGRIGGLKSGFVRKERSKMKQNEAVLEANELKERKGKEITNGVSTPPVKKLMNEPTIELDDLGEVIPNTTPKKYKHKGQFYGRIIIWYMKLKGETEGNANRYLNDLKDLATIAEGQFKKYTEAQLEKEIKSRILIFKKYQESKNLSWSLKGVHNNWNKTMGFLKEIKFSPDEV